jgi:integrase
LSTNELAKLGGALRALEKQGGNTSAIAIIRLLALTGARKSEISALLWDEIDFGRQCLRLRDSKTGAKIIPLGAPALEILTSVPSSSSPLVFPGATGTNSFQGV